nr:uncharacterized protein LOC109171840 [Ipomoea batatas]
MAANANSAGQSRSEKYGAWMLVTRKERRNRPNRANQPGYGPTFDRRQGMPAAQHPAFEGLPTHSRFASLESLEETNPAQDQYNPVRGVDLQQPEDALPRIITNGKKNQRSPIQSNSGTHRKLGGTGSGRQVQFDFQNRYQTDQYGGNQMAYRGGYQPTNRGAGINHSPKDDPPDDEQIGGENFSSDAVMMEGDVPGESFGFVANSHMRS